MTFEHGCRHCAPTSRLSQACGEVKPVVKTMRNNSISGRKQEGDLHRNLQMLRFERKRAKDPLRG